jgi:hypothetical protein
MRKTNLVWLSALMLLAFASPRVNAAAPDSLVRPASERFAGDSEEVPHFRRHVVAVAGRLGCNGRACHGSFQGKGEFRLSLFGYDFAEDHKNLLAGDSQEGIPRANAKDPAASHILRKPTLQDDHEGGERMKVGSWQYNLLHKWIKGGAQPLPKNDAEFAALEVTPSELPFQRKGEKVQLRVIARWKDGTREDVTCLCRFRTNNEQVAKIDENGLVTSGEPGDTHVVVFYDNGVQPIPVIRPVSDLIGSKYPQVPTPTKIDQLVVQKLRKLGMVPSELSSDAEFLRRVSLDITGTLPTPKEVESFLADKSANKRAKKIDELLERPGYAAWWTTKLCDITGNNDQLLNQAAPIQGRASQDWYDWIHKRVADNIPYDELAAGIVLAKSRNDGETYTQYAETMSKLYGGKSSESYGDRQYLPHYWVRTNFRTTEDRAIGFAYTFMGIRIQCAQCHKHPFDQWTKKDFDDFKGFFGTVIGQGRNVGAPNAVSPECRKEYDEIVKKAGLEPRGNAGQQQRNIQTLLREGKVIPFSEVYAVKATPQRGNEARKGPKQRAGQGIRVPTAKLLGGETIDLTKQEDVRRPLMQWLRSKDNPYFARSFVNRVWAGYFNVGIVNPPDDLSLANAASNKPLLDYLAEGFIASNYDMKWLHREIANSRTYQLTWKPNETNRLDESNFSRAVPRRLPAEVAVDAIAAATASDDGFEKMVQDMTGRSVAIPGTGNRNNRAVTNFALTVFGRSTRESNCDCDRSMEASLLQTVFLQNDQEVLGRIDRARDGWLGQIARQLGGSQPTAEEAVRERGKERRKLDSGNVDRQIAQLRRQIEEAEKGGNTKRVAQLREQLAAMTRKGPAEPPKAQAQPAAKKSQPVNTTEIVKQAYLRTLSRYPDSDELARCRKEIETSSDTTEGVRSVLWALLNTKEFIVNH